MCRSKINPLIVEFNDIEIDLYTHCNYDCLACSRIIKYGINDKQDLKVKPNYKGIDELKRITNNKNFMGKKVLLCSNTDPYPKGVDTLITRDAIKIIKKSGNNVAILTRSGNEAKRDFDLLDYNDSYGITVPSLNSNSIELNSSSTTEKISTIIYAKQIGIKTWVYCEPIFDVEFIIC